MKLKNPGGNIRQKFENVGVMNDYSSSEVLNFAELMIHSGCTTGLEAKLLGTPVISFNPLKDEHMKESFLLNAVKKLTIPKK